MDWCRVCCTLHEPSATCPGPLDATGPEEEVRRVKAFTGRVEFFGIRVARSGRFWRARIATLPRTLWCVPGRRETIKFVGPTSSVAVEKALAFIFEHCSSRGHRMLDANARIVEFTSIGADGMAQQPVSQRDPRIPHDVPARFGTATADRPARTFNLSHGGMFLATRRPLPVGREIRLVLDVKPFEIPLQGTVAWSRQDHSPDRPSGMGIQLRVPPTMYTRYVRQLREQQLADGET